MQVNNEDLYFLYIYVLVISENERELEKNLEVVTNLWRSL